MCDGCISLLKRRSGLKSTNTLRTAITRDLILGVSAHFTCSFPSLFKNKALCRFLVQYQYPSGLTSGISSCLYKTGACHAPVNITKEKFTSGNSLALHVYPDIPVWLFAFHPLSGPSYIGKIIVASLSNPSYPSIPFLISGCTSSISSR